MQEQEGGRRRVGEKNKSRMRGTRGYELEKEKERRRERARNNVAEKETCRAEARRREKERNVGNFVSSISGGIRV